MGINTTTPYVPATKAELIATILDRLDNALYDGQEKALKHALRDAVAGAIIESSENHRVMTTQWHWLDTHLDDPRWRDRCITLLERLYRYTQLEDAIARARVALGVDTEEIWV